MKQRLIDAENFPNALKEMMIEISKNRGLPKEDWFLFGFDEFVIALDVIDLVRDMPTVEAIPIEQLLNILPKYDDYIHTKTYPYNETMEDIYSKGYEEGWNACLKHIKEELADWEKENE